MNKPQRNSLPTRLAAMQPGASMILEDATINAARLAAKRVMGRTGTPFVARFEGSGRHDPVRRVVVYCGQAPERIVTSKAGVQRFAGRRKIHSVMAKSGFAEKERWFGFSLDELKEQVAHGWLRFCAKRGLDPKWA